MQKVNIFSLKSLYLAQMSSLLALFITPDGFCSIFAPRFLILTHDKHPHNKMPQCLPSMPIQKCTFLPWISRLNTCECVFFTTIYLL